MLRKCLAVVTAISVIALAGCAGGRPSAPAGGAGAPAAGGGDKEKTVVVAFEADVPTQDPHMHNERVAIIVNWHVFDSLLTRDPKTMEVVPHLAESFRTIDDRTWEFKLRKDVKFHNGEPFNADAAKFSLERVLNPDQKSPQRGNISAIEKVDKVDDYTIRITTKAPYPILHERLTYLSMVPPKYLKDVGDQQFGIKPIGTGPFRFERWDKGDKTVLVANKEYWKGAPKVDKVIFRGIPEKATQLAEMRAGGIDIIRQIPPDLVGEVEKGGNARIATVEILRTWYISMNLNDKPFSDERVRQAIAHAINVDAIQQSIFKASAVRVPAVAHPKQFGFDPSIKAREYNPDKAKQLLAEAGYPNGFSVVLHHYVAGAGHQVADAIAADLAKVGIKAEIKYYADQGVLIAASRAGKIPFEMGTWGSFSTFDADAFMQPFLHEQGTYGPYHRVPGLHDLLEKARSTLDKNERQKYYTEAQKVIVDKVPMITMFAPHDIYGISKRVNYTPRADEVIYVYDATVNH